MGAAPSELSSITTAPLSIALMLLRDSAACVFLAFGPKRGVANSLLYLALINGLLPFLAHSSGLPSVAYLIMPINHPSAIASILISAIHALMAIALAFWRWQALQSAQR
jgi:hypothetical protein